ncbi:hypothetical protein N431DRAFT_210855 [Stipitochalara longipes BDJ]|nr:hypothetical protein N431DRAFT_210855 [Stipitochalara longipes BDJ]
MRALRVKILPRQIGDGLGWYRNVVMPARTLLSFERVSCFTHQKTHFTARIKSLIVYCSSTKLLIPPSTRHYPTGPLPLLTHSGLNLFNPIEIENALSILHASRAPASSQGLSAQWGQHSSAWRTAFLLQRRERAGSAVPEHSRTKGTCVTNPEGGT